MNELILKLLQENPDAIIDMFNGAIDKYKPLVYGIGKCLLDVYKDYANNEDVHTTNALAYKNRYDAFIKVGFNKDQAMALLLNENLQLQKNMQNSFVRRGSEIKK